MFIILSPSVVAVCCATGGPSCTRSATAARFGTRSVVSSDSWLFICFLLFLFLPDGGCLIRVVSIVTLFGLTASWLFLSVVSTSSSFSFLNNVSCFLLTSSSNLSTTSFKK